MSCAEVVRKQKAHAKPIVGLRFVKDPETGTNYLISIGNDVMKVWEIDGLEEENFNLRMVREVSVGRCTVQHFDVSPTGRLVSVIGVDSTLRKIMLHGDSLEPQTEKFNTGFMNMRFCALFDAGFLTLSFSNTLKVLSMDGQVVRSAEIEPSHIKLRNVTALAVSSSANKIALASNEGHVCLVDGVSLNSSPNFEAHMKRIRDMTFLQNDERLLTASDDRTIRLHNIVDTPQKKAIRTYCGHTSIVTGISVDRASNDERFASSANDKKCILWDVNTAAKLHIFDVGSEVVINCIAISGNGRYVSYGNEEGSLFVNELPPEDIQCPSEDGDADDKEMQIDDKLDDLANPTSPPGLPMEMSASEPAVVERILKGFNPAEHGLSDDFLLTKLTAMKGCGCKVPRAVLLELLDGLNEGGDVKTDAEVGIGLDSCVIPLRHKGMFLVQTTDFFYPLIDDPYLMGRVTCANVLSDLYAMGVVSCDNMLMLLGVAKDMNDKERDVIVGQFMQGFKDAAKLAGTKIRGGQTVRCPWLLLGGVGTSVVTEDEMSKVDAAVDGDVLVLTKPIGGQVAVNSYEWLKKGAERFTELQLDEAKVRRAFQQVCEQMTRLNINAAKMLHKHGAHASTDVTGFGLLGHADNLAKAQKAKVQFVIETLPVIEYMDEIAKKMPGNNGFNLFGGTSAETSGGLLLALPADKAQQFCKDLEEIDGFPAWIVGRVQSALDGVDNGAVIASEYTVVPVASRIH